MPWDITQPTTATKLRLVPSVITPNWSAIQNGDVPAIKLRIVNNGAPAALAGSVYLYSTVDGTTGFNELYAVNSNGNLTQLTRSNVFQLTPTAPLNAGAGYFYLPGGLLFQWGANTAIWNGTNDALFPIAFSAAPYSVTANQQFSTTTTREFVQVSAFTSTRWTPRLISDGGGNVTAARAIFWMAVGPA